MAHATRARDSALPCPGVSLAPDYRARVERLVTRLAPALARREGGGRSALDGAGTEFVGHRPYRPGDDPRTLDWNLFARLEQPYVRVLRREARERWFVALDTSASMGVGPPGKLQRAAEIAGALAALGLARDCEVVLAPLMGETLVLTRLRGGGLSRLCGWLETLRAEGASTLVELARRRDELARASRVFWIADPFAGEPRELLALAPRARGWHVLHLLAPLELEPPALPAIEWRDPESARTLQAVLDRGVRAAYAADLARVLASWRAAARAHGARHSVGSTALDFEAVVHAALAA